MIRKNKLFSKANLLDILIKNTNLTLLKNPIFDNVIKADARTAYRFCLTTNSYYLVDKYGLRLFGRLRSFNHRDNSLNQGLFTLKTDGEKIIEHNMVQELESQYPFIFRGNKNIIFIESKSPSENIEEIYNVIIKNNLSPSDYILNLVDTSGSQWEHYFEFLASEMFIKKGYLTDVHVPWSYHGTPDFAAYKHKLTNLLIKKNMINFGALIIELSSIRFFNNKTKEKEKELAVDEEYSVFVGEVKSKQSKSQILEYLQTGLPFKGYEFIPNKKKQEKYSGLIKINSFNKLETEEAPENPFYNPALLKEDLTWFEKYLKIILFGNLTREELFLFLKNKLGKDKKFTFMNLINLAEITKFEEILKII